jgi:hypothetical protein
MKGDFVNIPEELDLGLEVCADRAQVAKLKPRPDR